MCLKKTHKVSFTVDLEKHVFSSHTKTPQEKPQFVFSEIIFWFARYVFLGRSEGLAHRRLYLFGNEGKDTCCKINP